MRYCKLPLCAEWQGLQLVAQNQKRGLWGDPPLGIQKTKATLIRATNFFSFHNAMRSALCPMRYPLGPTIDQTTAFRALLMQFDEQTSGFHLIE